MTALAPEIILGIITLLNGAQFFYTKSLGNKIDKLTERMDKLSNGCFQRHMKLERELGENGVSYDALHKRIDEIESIKERSRL